ncbi:hypothetical protein NQ314_007029 [Rhamnusium bicolor]|uniref:Uncharacterized protein n=1 Tax=Rhamnusium bicolor TaxID=1586634 RepID=A0AAV8YTG5_9CUCU|nr:hypothetical protein NQ314_007029 [Rhamnusium bicolor]
MSYPEINEFESLQQKYESSGALELLERIEQTLEEERENDNAIFDVLFILDNSSLMTSFIRTAVRCILIECIDQLFVLRNINSQDSTDFINVVSEYCSIEDR